MDNPVAKIITLGTKGGPRYVQNGSWQTSTVIDVQGRPYVIDCGLGVTSQLVNSGYQLSDLHTILITHYHSDHTLELGTLLHTAWCSGLSNTVKIYGPKGLKQMMQGFFQYQSIDMAIRCEDEAMKPLPELLELHEFGLSDAQEGLVFEDDWVKVHALRNIHPPFSQSYAFRFEFGESKITLSGDTRYLEAMIDFARGSSVLLHEVMIKEGIHDLIEFLKPTKPNIEQHFYEAHTLANDVGRIATEAGVKKLVLHHFVPCDMYGKKGIDEQALTKEIRSTYWGELVIAQDGSVITL